jgi:multidrug efflux system membrane fusion protein
MEPIGILGKKHLTPALLLLAFAALLTGCGKGSGQAGAPGAPGAARPAVPVVVADVQRRDIPIQISGIGNVEAYQMVQIKSQVNGQIQNIFFKEGQDVHKGQLLVQLDKRPFQAALEQAMGTLKKDQAQAANSKLQQQRYDELEKQGVIASQVADQQRAQSQADAAAVYADKAAVDAARVQLQYTDIDAPINGRTGALLINNGNLIKANDTPYLVQLNQISPIYVSFTIPENELAEVRKYDSHKPLKVLAYPKGDTQPAEGVLTFIDNGVDTTTGTVRLKATFVNKDKRLWPGEYVDAVLEMSVQKNAMVVPTRAIQTGQQGEYVYIVTPQSTAESRPVVTGGTYKNLTLISSGLEAGQKVIVDGQVRVAPNAKVAAQSGSAATQNADNVIAPAGGGE